MKKINVLALSVASVLVASSFAANAALENSWTVGARGGWAHQFADDSSYAEVSEKNGYGVGLYGEYNFTNWAALGLGFNYMDGFEAKLKDASAKPDFSSFGPELYGRFAWSFDDVGSDIFAKIGVAYITTDVEYGGQEQRFAPLVGVGAQYAFTKNFAVRVGYDYYFKSYDENDQPDMDTGLLYVGAQYTFGGPVAPVAAPVEREVVRVTESHTLDASMLFPFDGSELCDEGKKAVGAIVADASKLANTEYEVYGYTDRIGAESYNQKLSEKRAVSVASELKAQGVTTVKTVEGRGESSPVTGNKCDTVKVKSELINCLSPDRRVEVVVSGDTTKEKVI